MNKQIVMDYEEYQKLVDNNNQNYRQRLVYLKKQLEEERLQQTIQAGYDRNHQIDFIRINITDIIQNIKFWLGGDEE